MGIADRLIAVIVAALFLLAMICLWGIAVLTLHKLPVPGLFPAIAMSCVTALASMLPGIQRKSP